MKTSMLAKLALAAMVMMMLAFAACSGGDDSTATDGDIDGDDATITCDPDVASDCPVGMYCSFEGICMDTADGDLTPDGDFEETRVLRSVPESELTFGQVEIGGKPSINVTIFNDGTVSLHLFDANWLAPQVNNPFTLEEYHEATIQPGQSYTFSVSFDARELGVVEGLLRINNDSDNIPALELDLSAEAVQQAGDAVIGSDPEALVFEDHALGRLPSQSTVRIGNAGDGASRILITAVYLNSQGEGPFSLSLDTEPTEEIPVEIQASQSVPIRVFFTPLQVGDYSDKLVVEYHTNADDNMQLYQIDVSARAINGVIALQPAYIDFGEVTLGQTAEIELRVINNNVDETVHINNVQVRMEDGSNWRNFYELVDPPAEIDLPPAQRHDFKITFTPITDKAYPANLVVATSYEGQSFYFPIVAAGSAANKPPIARIAQRDNGPDITAPIPLPTQSPLEFFGNISYDPDGDSSLLTYEWFLQKPSGSTAALAPDATGPIVNVLFDLAGTYLLTLVVTDEEGLESDPKSVQIQTESGLSTVKIEMIASGISGESDVDLSWILPLGTSCNENNVAASGYCSVPTGYGSVRFEGCAQASVCTNETVVHANAPDGNYQIRILFDEDCSKSWPEDCLLWGSEQAEVDIIISADGQQLYRIDNERLNEEGDQITWNFPRVSGVWQQPTKVVK